MISHYAPQYKNFAEPDGVIAGAYGPRLRPQVMTALDLLQHSPTTRRAVIGLWTPNDLDIADYAKDVPCTLTYQFLIEGDQLNMIATMRSNDAWLGFPYDVFVNTCVQRLFAGTLGLRTGYYQHQVGSMHIYERNAEDATIAYDEQSVSDLCFTDTTSRLADIDTAIRCEEIHRKELTIGMIHQPVGFVSDLLDCITSQPTLKVLKDAHIRRHGPSR